MKLDYRKDRIAHLVQTYWKPNLLCKEQGKEHFIVLPNGALCKASARHLVLEQKYEDFFQHVLAPHLQSCAHHLNSSQMFCFNFFVPLCCPPFCDLSRLLCRWLHLSALPEIEDVKFEYEPEGPSPRRTNFDFFVKTKCGSVSFEVKYTEGAYGGVSKDRRSEVELAEWKRKQWCFYGDQVRKSQYLSKIGMEEFFANYQILRNVAYVTANNAQNEFAVFLSPAGNSAVKLLPEIEDGKWSHVCHVDAERIVDDLVELGADKSLVDYYNRFTRFYFGRNN